jgi:diguanylate cyclase (GGDEF)-like protein/PAS domain S-box-containing protein
MVEAKVWGCLGVDSCTRPRRWATFEIDLLKMMANFIGTAIVRDRYVGLLRASEQKFRTVLEAALDGMVVIDSAGLIQYWNPAAERILGYSSSEVVGRPIHGCLAPARYQQEAAAGMQHFHRSGTGSVIGSLRECSCIRKDGTEIPIELSVAPVPIAGSWSAVGIVRDISARKEAERRIVWLACHDALTKLPNRSLFVGEVETAIARHRRSGEGSAVLYLDLDRFKEVNDTLGHSAGDALLKQAAGRLRSNIRDSDSVARFGGDEFAILATNLARPLDAAILAGKLVEEMARTFLIAGAPVHCPASIGVAICDDEAKDAESLLAHADAAMYRAKSEERGSFRFYTPALHNDVRHRVGLLRDLEHALDHDEFRLLYQPQLDMPTGEIIGVEALLRWQHPDRGLLAPGDFLELAEDSGLGFQLGQFVLGEACRQTRRWLDQGIRVPVVGVNISPLQFKAVTRLSAEIQRAIDDAGVPSTGLEVELTETALMQVLRDNSECLRHLREQGIRIAIDDFGTGYSCLHSLRLLPISRLKVAQTFVEEITANPGSAAIARAAIRLATELDLSVVASGVETWEQARLLIEWGCRAGQGFYFSEPLDVATITPLLRAGCLRASKTTAAALARADDADPAAVMQVSTLSPTPFRAAKTETNKCPSSRRLVC